MLFSTSLLGVMAALAGLSTAQTTAQSRPTETPQAPSPEEIELLEQARAAYPICAQTCMAKLIPQSECSMTDLPCLCTNEELNLKIAGCALEACTTYEGLQTKNVSMTMCGAPVRDKSAEPLVVGMVFGALALLAFGLRMCAVIVKDDRMMGWDDYMCTINVLLAGPPTAFAVTLTDNGLGKDMWTLPLQNIKNVLEYYYLGEIFYFASITATKLSILLFILRVFPEKRFRMIVYGVCGLVVAYGVSFIIATALQCSPVEWSWQQVDDDWGTGSCNNIHLQGWMSAILNIVIDLIMLALPLKNLWGLQMKLKKKIMIMFMFCLGIFVTIISVIRLHSLVLFANSQNITWDYSEAAWWSTLEIHVGIICACLPSVRQLFVHLGATILGTTKNSSNGSKGYNSKGSSGVSSGKFGSSNGKGGDSQHAPKRGDEGDFVPLVEYSGNKAFDKASSYSVGVSNAHSASSV